MIFVFFRLHFYRDSELKMCVFRLHFYRDSERKRPKIGPGSKEKEIEFERERERERDTGFPKTRAQALRFGSINSITLADRNRGDFRQKQRFSRFRL